MNIHKNARTTPRGREWIVSQAASGQTPKAVAGAVGVCPRTVRNGSTVITKKALQAWPTAARGRTGCTDQPRRLSWSGSKHCAASG